MPHVAKHAADAPTPKNSMFADMSGSANRSRPNWKSSRNSAGTMSTRPQANVRFVIWMVSSHRSASLRVSTA